MPSKTPTPVWVPQGAGRARSVPPNAPGRFPTAIAQHSPHNPTSIRTTRPRSGNTGLSPTALQIPVCARWTRVAWIRWRHSHSNDSFQQRRASPATSGWPRCVWEAPQVGVSGCYPGCGRFESFPRRWASTDVHHRGVLSISVGEESQPWTLVIGGSIPPGSIRRAACIEPASRLTVEEQRWQPPKTAMANRP